MLRSASEARQNQKWWIGIISHRFGRIRLYYASRTSHDVVVACFCQQVQIRFELLDEGLPIFSGKKSADDNRPTHSSRRVEGQIAGLGRTVAHPSVTER